MDMRRALGIALLPILLLLLSGGVFQLAGVGDPQATTVPSPSSVVAMAVLETAVLAIAVLTAIGRGRSLALGLFFAYFGAKSFMSQIESAFFISDMPVDQVLRVVLAGFVIALVFCPLVVWILGRWRGDPAAPRPLTRNLWRWAALPIVYLSLYFVFGYYIAWSQPELRTFYDGEDPSGFWNHLGSLLTDDPSLIPFQIVRTGLWVAFALPLLRQLGGSPLRAGCVLGGVLGVGLTAQLLLANPFMPEAVRMIHLAETLPSTILWGVCLGLLLLPSRKEPRAEPLR